MKLLPLNTKKKISKRMHWFGVGSAAVLLAGSLLSGGGGMMTYISKGGAGGKAEEAEMETLKQQADHLVQVYQLSKSMDAVTRAAGNGWNIGTSPAGMQAQDKSLKDKFNAEEQAVGLALAHARLLSPGERETLYREVGIIQPAPAYFKDDGGTASFILFNYRQSQVMDRPGFRPTLETATEIAQAPTYAMPVVLGLVVTPFGLGLGTVFGFCAARKRLGRCISAEEAAIEKAAEDRKKTAQAALASEAERQKAEAERIASLPPSLDRDISVKQIKLAAKTPAALKQGRA